MPMSKSDKEELRKLLAEASPGPWKAYNLTKDGIFPSVYVGPVRRYPDDSGEYRPRIVINEAHDPNHGYAGADRPTFRATAKLIAFLRNHAEDLLD